MNAMPGPGMTSIITPITTNVDPTVAAITQRNGYGNFRHPCVMLSKAMINPRECDWRARALTTSGAPAISVGQPR